jgi:ubiquinone/menaquinone biosynthesis C-methylase UbiE
MTFRYDELALAYSRNRSIHPGVLDALADGLDARSRILEVGCGTGNYLTALIRSLDCDGYGCDPSAGMLERATAQRVGPRWVRARAEALPFASATFDRLFSVDVIHHVADRGAYFREARRVLRPGGALATVTDSHEQIALRSPLARYFPETIEVDRKRYPPIETLRSELTAAGFDGTQIEPIELRYPLTELAPYRDRAFSCLHAIGEEAWRRGLERLETAAAASPVEARSFYTIVWAR